MAAIARGAWHWYQRQSKARPIRTQVISSGLLWATGDCLAQQVDLSMSRQRRRVEQRERESNASKLHLAVLNPEQTSASSSSDHNKVLEKFDFKRVFTTSLFGFAFVGPLGHFWYLGLDHLVKTRMKLRPSSAPFLAAKVLADTVIFGPLHLGAFFTWTGLASGRSWERVKQEVMRDFLPAFMTEGAVWPLVQILNFRFVPVPHQLLFVNGVCVLDSAWLSWLKYQDDAPWKQYLSSVILRKPMSIEGAQTSAAKEE